MSLNSVISELRRRRVFRGAGLYLVGAWIALQLGDVLADPLALPVWSLTALLYLLILGFPIALLLSWRYQLTDAGLVRSSSDTAREAGHDPNLTSLDYVIFGTVVLVIGIAILGLMSQKEALVLELEADTDAPRIEEEKALPLAELPNSIAVLPFADRSATQDQEYFADGLADTLLHVLSQVQGLKVAARTSSFAFKGQNESVKSIASQLGVANILEGSVQKSGNRIRVIAQLVEAEQGTQIWSHTFDGTLDDIFSIQDQIAEEVVDAMQLVLVDADSSRLAERYRPVTAAYDQLVLGRYAVAKGKVDDINAAVAHFEAAISIDPNYPLPYVYLADALAVQEIYALGLKATS